MRITWRKQPNESGRAAVCQGPRGADLRIDGYDVGFVRPYMVGFGKQHGWFWWAISKKHGVPLDNTSARDVTFATLEFAKDACEKYVREQLKKAKEIGA